MEAALEAGAGDFSADEDALKDFLQVRRSQYHGPRSSRGCGIQDTTCSATISIRSAKLSRLGIQLESAEEDRIPS